MQQEEIKVAAGEKWGTTGEVRLPSFLAKAVVDVVSNKLNKNQSARCFCRLMKKETLAHPLGRASQAKV